MLAFFYQDFLVSLRFRGSQIDVSDEELRVWDHWGASGVHLEAQGMIFLDFWRLLGGLLESRDSPWHPMCPHWATLWRHVWTFWKVLWVSRRYL